MNRKTVAVIGAGPSGCMAAVTASKNGAKVLLFDKNPEVARKILATGNGRCNLTNLKSDTSCWYSDRSILAVIRRFDQKDLMAFFNDLGVHFHDRNGYVYPRTDQASTIADALKKALRLSGTDIHTNEGVRDITSKQGRFIVETFSGKYSVDKVIIATGGLAAPAFGCSGDGYRFAKDMGHSVNDTTPSLTSLITDKKRLKPISGVRCSGEVTLVVDGVTVKKDAGEIQFTDTTISGIPVFQISHDAGRALRNRSEVDVCVDLLPEFTEEMWEKEKCFRLSQSRDLHFSEFFLGLVNNKFQKLILSDNGISGDYTCRKYSDEKLLSLMDELRHLRFRITGITGYDKAQVTAGGIPLSQINTKTMESKITEGLYICGELLDVDGICGGYNLQWAFTTGFIAGSSV